MANNENEKENAASETPQPANQQTNKPTNPPNRPEDHIETVSLLDLMAELAQENEPRETTPPQPDNAPTQTVFPPPAAQSGDSLSLIHI